MGEENGIKLEKSVMFMAMDNGDYAKVAEFKDIPETEIRAEDIIKHTNEFNPWIPLEEQISFELRSHTKAVARKWFLGFGDCKGPARLNSLYKWNKLRMRLQTRRKRICKTIAWLHGKDKIDPGDVTMYGSIDITGLPCTDFIEWAWMCLDDESYWPYRHAKTQRTGRSKNRVRRKRNGD